MVASLPGSPQGCAAMCTQGRARALPAVRTRGLAVALPARPLALQPARAGSTAARGVLRLLPTCSSLPTAAAMYLPSGLNFAAATGDLKVKWCSRTLHARRVGPAAAAAVTTMPAGMHRRRTARQSCQPCAAPSQHRLASHPTQVPCHPSHGAAE